MKERGKILAPHPVQYQVPLRSQLIADARQAEVAYYQHGARRGAMAWKWILEKASNGMWINKVD